MRTGQAKSVRKHSPAFTWHAQLFHKHYSCAMQRSSFDFRGIFQSIFAATANLAQNECKFA
jgi:hypothetical protein